MLSYESIIFPKIVFSSSSLWIFVVYDFNTVLQLVMKTCKKYYCPMEITVRTFQHAVVSGYDYFKHFQQSKQYTLAFLLLEHILATNLGADGTAEMAVKLMKECN